MPLNRDVFEKKFHEEYEKLNAQQRQAVDSIEGPVMVIAGPGTGKTQVLACRIGKILLEGAAHPENILCLTFTDAGAVAMRQRLLQLIGPEAYQVNVHTFHSFCHSVIQENIQYFNKKELEPVTDLERVQYLTELIDAFDDKNPLKRFKGEVYYDMGNLKALFSAMKKEAWEPQWLLQKIDEYVNHIMPETDGFYNKREKAKGHFAWTQKGKDELEKMEKLKAAVKEFDNYQAILHREHRYDFDDMINWVIRLFENNREVLLRYQEQLQYFLVDEYQDSSGSQNRIVELLISYWEKEKPNIFVVGDDDQSIFRFQGANLKNLMTLAGKFGKDLEKIVLTQNYRSVQPVLEAAKALIEYNEQRLVKQIPGLSKDLIASHNELKGLKIQPVIRVYENEFSEYAHVAAEVSALIADGVNPGEIAIIYREHRFGDELIKFLHLLHVPFFAKRSINLLEDVFINKIITLLRYTVAETDTPYSGEHLLFEILHYDFFSIRPHSVAAICHEIADNEKNNKGPVTLREYLLHLAKNENGKLFSAGEETGELIKVSALLENLQKAVFNKPVAQWFESLINEAGILAYIMKHEDKIRMMDKLTCLFEYMKDELHRQPDMKLQQLVKQMDLMMANNLALELVQTTGSETGVNLVTCHGSKGLEFEYVFLINARNDVWENKKIPNKGFRLPPNIFDQETEGERTEELRRLFYVSVTRAKKYLFISYPQMKNDGNLLEPSRFTEEIKQALGTKAVTIRLSDEEKFRFNALRFGVVQKPVLADAENEYISRLLQHFSMNVTALNNYLDCPLKFYYNNLVRVPGAKSEAAAFGSAVHAALSDFINNMMNNGRKYPGKELLLNRLVFHLLKEREIFTRESLQRFRLYGLEILSGYFDKYYNPPPTGDFIKTEYPLTKVTVNHIPLKGFADKIQFWGNEIVITDFKTGKPEKAKRRGEFLQPGIKDELPHGGNYWRQAVFYKILADNLPGKNWKVQHTQFDFIEPNDNGVFVIERLSISKEEEAQVKKQIEETWEKIQRHEFYTGCGKPDCEWCNFAKDNKLYISLIEEEEAEPEAI
jgi:DNA helicase-2/ATP-dependent DNA helicase PcrA